MEVPLRLELISSEPSSPQLTGRRPFCRGELRVRIWGHGARVPSDFWHCLVLWHITAWFYEIDICIYRPHCLEETLRTIPCMRHPDKSGTREYTHTKKTVFIAVVPTKHLWNPSPWVWQWLIERHTSRTWPRPQRSKVLPPAQLPGTVSTSLKMSSSTVTLELPFLYCLIPHWEQFPKIFEFG